MKLAKLVVFWCRVRQQDFQGSLGKKIRVKGLKLETKRVCSLEK